MSTPTHMFQRRPKVASPPVNGRPPPAHGFCYLARQASLVFGSDRKQPVEWRPVVSLRSEGELAYVLPSTTKERSEFFRLPREACFVNRLRQDVADTSYLCPRQEVIDRKELIEIGVLLHEYRISLATWLRERTRTAQALPATARPQVN